MSNTCDFVIDNGVLEKYVGPGGDVIIPTGVTTIGFHAFKDCSSLTSVMIPQTVERIYNCAFFDSKGSYGEHFQSVYIQDLAAWCRIDFDYPDYFGSLPSNPLVYAHNLYVKGKKVNELVIPEGVDRIKGAFYGCSLTSVIIPRSVSCIGRGAFGGCTQLKSVTIQEGVKEIDEDVFFNCTSLESVRIPEGIEYINADAFSGCKSLKNLVIPKSVKELGDQPVQPFENCSNLTVTILCKDKIVEEKHFKHCPESLGIAAFSTPLSSWQKRGLGMHAARGFISHFSDYSDQAIIDEYISYISSQRRKLLPAILGHDNIEILRLLADKKKITKKNVEQDYLLPAMQCKAEKCVAFLESLFPMTGSKGKQDENVSTDIGRKMKERELWDRIHFSLDGKSLLQYPDEPERRTYEVPDGTKEICKGAFNNTNLEKVILPQSVTTIRNGSFRKQTGKPFFIRLSANIKNVPNEAFCLDEAGGIYYISSPVVDVAAKFNDRNDIHIIYTGGPLDDLPPKTKKNAVLGFLYAVRTGCEDMSAWKESYWTHIKKSWKTYVKLSEEDEVLLKLMLDESLLTQKGVETLLDFAEQKHKTEMKAALLDYQQSHFSNKRKKDDLTLSEEDQEFRRTMQMAERREKVKHQKGIKGLVFVSTGYFEHFGEVYGNEYAFYGKDMSDLKAYIEERGGVYRSAVSSKTDYLICNDPNSDSAKSRKAAELGVPVITEEQFLKMANEKE